MLVDSMDIDVPVFLVREAPSWVKPIKEFLINGTLPVDENESRRIQRRSKAYTIINGEVYKRSVTGVLQRCVEPEEGKEMLAEIHQGECGHHASSRALVAKVFRHGFYWPTALENAEDLYTGEGGDSIMSWPRSTSPTSSEVQLARQADDPWYIAYQDESTQWCSQRMDLEEKVANLGDELARKNLMIFELKRTVEEEKKNSELIRKEKLRVETDLAVFDQVVENLEHELKVMGEEKSRFIWQFY
ncbi:hypothetical protein QYE76_027622 [Lolium multiflorum]|uniref:Integrase zinc-binding domain-containing protein n=1 Tax=Lolium multiflorum TaxID=4521 RepID=A0AAD8VF36_LOLMU|nr:hypothetical protein QYE76_027622 [Lolium multiflorum]